MHHFNTIPINRVLNSTEIPRACPFLSLSNPYNISSVDEMSSSVTFVPSLGKCDTNLSRFGLLYSSFRNRILTKQLMEGLLSALFD